MTSVVDREQRVREAQRRLLLALRASHGPRMEEVWSRACTGACVVSTGPMSLDELDRVTAQLAARGGLDAVAAGTCRVSLLFARQAAARPADSRPVHHALPHDEAVRAALVEPEALDEDAWRRRLAELEAEFDVQAPDGP